LVLRTGSGRAPVKGIVNSMQPSWFQEKAPRAPSLLMALAVVIAAACLATSIPAGSTPSAFILYRVKEGDTFASVAARHHLTEAVLRKRNGLDKNAVCKPGMLLRIPESFGAPTGSSTSAKKASSPTKAKQQDGTLIKGGAATGRLRVFKVHVVQAGESLSSIAAKYGVTENTLREENGFAPDTKLVVHQSVVIPVAEHVLRSSPVSRGLPPSGRSRPTASAPPSPAGSTVPSTPAPATSQASSPRSERPTSSVSLTPRPSPPKRVIGRLATVIHPGGLIRQLPSPHSRPLYTTRPGNQLVVGGQRGNWYAVVMRDGSYTWIPKKYVRLETTELVEDTSKQSLGNQAAVRVAMSYLGCPYRYGGSSRAGIDCSALVKLAYAASGRTLPRTAAAQFNVGYAVPPNLLQPGDRLYFSSDGRRIDHCALYLGNGRMIHASGSRGRVVIDSLFSRKYWSMFRGARR